MSDSDQSSSRGRGRPRDVEREESVKQGLIAAAMEMLAEKSYKDISIREIARRADVNSAMISYHFGSKEALFIEVVTRGFEQQSSSAPLPMGGGGRRNFK